MQDKINLITLTVEGIPVKNLTWKPLDNIIVGLVKCPYGKPDINDGFVSCQWSKYGKPLKLNRGRNELNLNL